MPIQHADDLPVSKRGAIRFTMTHGFRVRFIMRSILLCCCLCFVATTASAIDGLPGSTWGILTHSVNGVTGNGGMGWINQGIDWFTLPGGITFNTYAEYRYRTQTKQQQYYDAEGPAVGFEFRKSFLKLGMDYYWEKYPEWPGGVQRSNNREFYLNGYYPWNLTRKSGTPDFPGAIWFNLTYDINGLTGSGGQGWINQGIDWFTLPGGITVNTYVEYRYRTETKQYDYYNAQGPAVGLEFKKSFLHLGADYYWQTYPDWPGGIQRSNSLEIYLTWFIDWDLKHRTPERAVSGPSVSAVPEPVQPPVQQLPAESHDSQSLGSRGFAP